MNSSADSPTRLDVEMVVNGEPVRRAIEARTLLIDFLRTELGLTGTHNGCSYGVCGACTVLVNGVAARSCIALAAQLDGATIETIESVSHTERGQEILETFSRCRGLQCGFCTPGVVMTLVELDRRIETPNRDEIEDSIDGHLCRCTGYAGIKEAVDQTLGRVGR
ncbi:MAG: (2Fe-2S)-binding protein [Actinomycetota bacterium]|nr:(2Fe-2S)-binding protein [Actinomycetota bacterium]